MRSILVSLALIAALITVSGCSTASFSKNMRAATAQSVGIVSVKALLDEVALDKYDVTKAKTVEVMTEVGKFLDTGKIGDLPLDSAKAAVIAFMKSKGWDQYVPAVEAILDILAAQKVPIEKIGADNIAILHQAFDAATLSANTSRIDWRRPVTPTDTTVVRAPRNVKVY